MIRYFRCFKHWLILLASLLAVGFLVIVAYVFFLPPPTVPEIQTACNAIWLGHTWIEDAHSPEEIEALAKKLKSHQINCLYLHASPLNPDSSFDTSRASYLTSFLQTYRLHHPEATIYAWMGMLTEDYEGESIGPKFALNDYPTLLEVKQTALELTSTYGFDGIHLDVEPVESGNDAFLVTLHGLREALHAQGKKLSVAVIFLATPERQEQYVAEGKRFLWSWLPAYYDTVSLFTDQLVIMHYQIGLQTPEEFTTRVAWHAEVLQAARQNTAVLMGLPTFAGDYKEAENLEAGLAGIDAALANGDEVDGLALYAEWTTDESEWADWDKFLK